MKKHLVLWLIFIVNHSFSQTVSYHIVYPTTKAHVVRPKVVRPKNDKSIIIKGELPTENLPDKPFGQTDKPFDTFNDGSQDFNPKSITPIIGRNFGANNLTGGTPADNCLAIANNGNILSVDNATIDYYKDTPDTIEQYQEWVSWEDDSLIFNNNRFFDPKCIYDLANDKFINLVLDHGVGYSESKIILSFSNSSDLTDTLWYHYEILADSIFPSKNYWFDYPNIAVNNDELFITINVFDTNSVYVTNCLLQIHKAEGYLNHPLVYRTFTDIENTSGNKTGSLYPLTDAMQSNFYNDGIFLVATVDGGSDSLYWWRLTGNLTDSLASIIPHSLSTTAYTYFNFASQPGGASNDRINVGRCRIRGDYYQNGKLHFVYMRSNSNWGQIVYSKIDTLTNTEQRSTYGSGSPNNYCYPTIAHFGSSYTEENAMIGFQKVGLSDYPSIGVINHDSTGFGSETIVKAGVGIVDLVSYDGTPQTYERLGDYIQIQRRYNSSPPTCWIVGSYAIGDTINHFGFPSLNGYNAWIAEIGKVGVGVEEYEVIENYQVYPNPTNREGSIYLTFGDIDYKKIKMLNFLGQLVYSIETENQNIEITPLGLMAGIYFIHIESNNKKYESKKIIVH